MSYPPIQSIKTVTVASNINQNGFGAVNQLSLGAIPQSVDEIVLKQVSFWGTAPDALLFLWNDFSNDILTSICCDAMSESVVLDVRIPLNGRVCPNQITFRVLELTTGNSFASTSQAGVLSVTLSLVTYAD